jgi:hypothetical protein
MKFALASKISVFFIYAGSILGFFKHYYLGFRPQTKSKTPSRSQTKLNAVNTEILLIGRYESQLSHHFSIKTNSFLASGPISPKTDVNSAKNMNSRLS